MALKISLLGAGSVVFAKTLIGDILQFPELSDATIALMDIDPARLKGATIMAERIIAKLGVRAKVEPTFDQREAIRGANYVLVTVQVGGFEPGTVLDFEIPRKYGLLQTIGDTLGVGGVFRALRTIPVINSFARDIAEVGAPGCLLLNYTNPMAMNCWAVDRAVGIPHIGLCHSVQGTSRMLCSFAQLPPEDVNYLVAGINHMAFFLRFEYKKQDAYPLLFALLDDVHFKSEKVRFEMMRRTGYFVTESSEHQSEYVPYFIHHGQEVIDRFDIPIDEYLRRCRAVMASWKDTEAELLGGEAGILVDPQSHEYGAYIIHACETNTPRVVYGNVPNRDLITNLPQGCCVEVPCLIDGIGVQPTRIGALPPQLAAICQTNINVQALTVEAALTKRREHVYHAVMLDPHASATLTLDKIWSMCDELIDAHQKVGLLGDFHPTIPNTGRARAGTGDRLFARVEPAQDGLVDEDADELALKITVTNPGDKSVDVPLAVASRDGSLHAEGAAQYIVRAPAGATVSQPLVVRRDGANGHAEAGNGAHAARDGRSRGAALELTSSLANVFCRGLNLPPRRVHQVAMGEPVALDVSMDGFSAATGTMTMRDGSLLFTFDVRDSQVRPGPLSSAWTGSSVELFFCTERQPAIRQIFLVPDLDAGSAHVVDPKGAPIGGANAEFKPMPAHYTISAAIPYEAAGLGLRAATFLFDVIINVTALGNVHSGGRASLNNKLNSNERSEHFSRVRISSAPAPL